MDNLVQSVPDTEKWKRLVSLLAKTSVEPSNEISVVSTPVSPRKYKRKTRRVPPQSKRKRPSKRKKVKRLSSKKKTKKRGKKRVGRKNKNKR